MCHRWKQREMRANNFAVYCKPPLRIIRQETDLLHSAFWQQLFYDNLCWDLIVDWDEVSGGSFCSDRMLKLILSINKTFVSRRVFLPVVESTSRKSVPQCITDTVP